MNSLFEQIWKKKIAFFVVFFVIFTLTYLVLVLVDFLPESPETAPDVQTEEISQELAEEEIEVVSDATAIELVKAEFPLSISIQKLDKVIPVLNPTSRTIADLDEALLDGVVRHPDSATMSQEGNVFILGHSSYLPNVLNRNFQAFNGIQNLEWGDIIEVATEDSVYQYRVEKVYRAKAQDVTVPIADTGNMLTLATCNSFGSADDRYIVEAKRVGVEVI